MQSGEGIIYIKKFEGNFLENEILVGNREARLGEYAHAPKVFQNIVNGLEQIPGAELTYFEDDGSKTVDMNVDGFHVARAYLGSEVPEEERPGGLREIHVQIDSSSSFSFNLVRLVEQSLVHGRRARGSSSAYGFFDLDKEGSCGVSFGDHRAVDGYGHEDAEPIFDGLVGVLGDLSGVEVNIFEEGGKRTALAIEDDDYTIATVNLEPEVVEDKRVSGVRRLRVSYVKAYQLQGLIENALGIKPS